jgi:phosphohistidine phosphatase
MKLYLLRHADAATLAEIDDQRAVSEKGKKQCKRVADFCRLHDLIPGQILASPLLRAQQTAKPVARKLGLKIETVPWLVYETETEKVIQQLAERSHVESIMLVGHEPDFSLLAAALLGSEREAIRVRKASLVLLEISEFKVGGARLEWSLPVKLM